MNLVDQLDSTCSRQDYGNNVDIAIDNDDDDDDDDDDGDGDGDEALLGQKKFKKKQLKIHLPNIYMKGGEFFGGECEI